jgi:hypothetical protein
MKVRVYFCKEEPDTIEIILKAHRISRQALDTIYELVWECEFKNILNAGRVWLKFKEDGFYGDYYYHLNYGLWSKALCKLSSLSDLKDLPHVLHTNDWAILILALVVSPLSGVGPMLDADILLVWSTIQFISYKRRSFR